MRTVLTLVALGLALPAAAQTASFVPGYRVVEGDTLRGQIAIGSEAEASRGFRFRTNPAASVEAFGVTDADAFGDDDGRHYRRHLFQIRAVPEADPATPNERLGFGRVVREGDATLLAFEVVDRRALFFLDLGDGPVGLYLVEDQVETSTGLRLRERPLYRQTLLTLLGGCGVEEPVYVDLPYSERALAEVVDAYNACVDPAYGPLTGPVAQRERVLGFEAGAGYLAGSFERLTPISVEGYSDPSPSAIHVQAALTVKPPFGANRLQFLIGLDYDHDVMRVVRGGPTRETQVNLLYVDLGGRYILPIGNAAIELGGGLLAGTVLEWTTEEDIEASTQTGALRFFTPGRSEASGGQYVEAGARLSSFPVGVRVRAQTTAFGPGPLFLPFAGSTTYRIRGVTVSAVATF